MSLGEARVPGLGLREERALDADHVVDGDAFCDRDDELDLCLDGFEDGCGRACRRHVDHGRVAAGGLLGLEAVAVDRDAEVRGACLGGRGPADDLGAVLQGAGRVVGALRYSREPACR